MLRFSLKYFLLTLLLFTIEVLIALYVRDNFVRPYLGDALVVILMYCFLRAFTTIKPLHAIYGVLAFAFLIEGLQYFKVVRLLNLEHSRLARTIIGTSFAWQDLIAYTGGAVSILLIEFYSKSILK